MPYDAASQKLNLSAGLASVGVAAVLVVLKLWALWATGALSIAASLADSAMDLFVSAAGLAAIIYAARPADDDHTFGHSAIEDLVSLGQAIFVAASGGLILWVSTERLMSPSVPLAAEGAGIAVMAVSAGLTAALVLWQRRVARMTGNKVVAADMLHYVGDLLPTLGAILALGLSARFGWSRADSVIAIFAAALMLRGALQIGLASWHALMDRAAPADVVQGIAEIAAVSPGVRGFHDLRTRTAGARIFVQLHIELDGAQSLEAAHAIARNLKRAIREAYPQADVIIHMDVWQG
ncbi:cation diffusion facilitator family transporter [Rhodobacter capsulatus]|uniref:cation diffusion facilitator family transporter n=1 Tax=Rhodobacter capsulatus TaxID=1061 RepID=UPI0006DD19C8|nr:cation diffusion facilitator family transporter [Rhodobacter capsulatus]KQB13283.1 ABC transporter permease [Rhodobacter capsulatus]KQB13542.1 ABC transporter permease [Rhodobacter capsulatus]PZX24268.1 ferrous-iron efflux pump FieF [Rhodobacter capsulatus]QNR63755.1 cation diffusion facilitator family transporter [Rhodobacter capsulatus]